MTRFRNLITLAAVPAFVLGMAACSDDPSEEELQSSLNDALVDAGMSEELADCVVANVEEQGIDLTDAVDNQSEYTEQFGEAGAACAQELGTEGIDPDAVDENVDLSEEGAARDAFITTFAQASGQTPEVSECVLDGLLDAGFTAGEITQAGADVTAAVPEALADCA